MVVRGTIERMAVDARSRYWIRPIDLSARYTVRALSVEDAALRVIWRWYGRKAGLRRLSGCWRKGGIWQAFTGEGEYRELGEPFLVEIPVRNFARQFPIRELPDTPFDTNGQQKESALAAASAVLSMG